MEMRKLGSSGPDISVVGFGAWEAGGDFWGPNEADERVVEAIRSAIDAGMTWIDTAEVYGRGRSEELVGKAVAGRRGDVLIFTKLAPRGSGTGFRPEEVVRDIHGSLDRLGIDHLDLYQLHWPDPYVPVEETWGAMAEVVDRGLARHIGVSNFDRPLLERCQAIRHVDSLQNKLSLLHPGDREDLLPFVQDQGIGYLAYSPLGLGLLAGAITEGYRFPNGDARGGAHPPTDFKKEKLGRNLQKVDRLRAISERLGVSVPTVSLRWVLEQPGVTGAIAGTRNPEHARSNAVAGSMELGREALSEIAAVFGIASG